MAVSLAIVVGTNRPRSMTLQVARHVADLHAHLDNHATLVDLAMLPPACFEPAAYAVKPPGFESFAEAILRADGVVIVAPEYNGSFPGVLKHFIDLLPFPEALDRKPACFIGLADGQWGALRAIEHLQQICLYRQAYLFPGRVCIPRVGEAFATGQISRDLAARLAEQARDFTGFCKAAGTFGRAN